MAPSGSGYVVSHSATPLPAALVTTSQLGSGDWAGRKVRFAGRVLAVRKADSTMLVEAEETAVIVDCALQLVGSLEVTLPDVGSDLIIMGEIDASDVPSPLQLDPSVHTVSADSFAVVRSLVIRALLIRQGDGMDVRDWNETVRQGVGG